MVFSALKLFARSSREAAVENEGGGMVVDFDDLKETFDALGFDLVEHRRGEWEVVKRG